MERALDLVLARAVEDGRVPGAVFVVVDRDGVVYEGAAGERVAGGGAAMTPDTVGAIFSMTKPITGAAAMHCVERGLIDLDAPAGEVCDELASVQVLDGFDPDGAPITRPPRAPVSLRNLLTHTSGFAYDLWDEDLARYIEVTRTPSVASGQLAALRLPLMFDPGTRWEYGIGIDWAGQMVERVSGRSLGEYFAEHITGPLAMTDTTFAPTAAMLDRAAGIHARAAGGALAPMEAAPAAREPEFEMGGGGLHGTMRDYANFIRMVLDDGALDGTRVLAPETVVDMTRNHIGALRVQPLISNEAQLSNDAEFFPGEPKTWGLTFQINERPAATGRAAGTLMWGGLANTYFWIDRANGLGGCYLSQILPFADPGSLGTFYALEAAVYSAA